MFMALKKLSQIVTGAVLVAQLGGCIFVDHDRDHWHHERPAAAVVYVR